MSGPVLTGARPYRFLDETSVGNGYVRLRALALLPVILVVLFAVVLGFETGGYGAEEDRDTRDMAWDYRSTVYQSTAFHKYFRAAYWPSYLELEVNEEVYDEVVVAAADRPVVLAAMPATAACQRVVEVPCLAAKPAHRDESVVGALNLGTDAGIWAVGNGRAFQRIAQGVNVGLLSDGVASVPNAYADAANLSSYKSTRLAELQEMRTRSAAAVLSTAVAAANGLACASDATGATCAWDQTQWDAWATLAFSDLATTNCSSAVDVCSQTAAALAQAAAEEDTVGNVAVRVVTGAWAASNTHLKDVVSANGGLPTVVTVANANGAGVLSAAANGAAAYDPMTDVAFGEGTAYVPPASVATIVATAASSVAAGAPLVGYARPPDFAARYYGLRGGASVGGARADLRRSFETSKTWRTRQSYLAPFFDIGLWPWEGQCADTGFNATIARDEGVYLNDFPAFNARGAVPSVAVEIFGDAKRVPAYDSACDFDAADADAGAADVTCSVSVLVGVEISVAATPAAGETLGAWRLVDVAGVYDDAAAVTTASTTTLNAAFIGSETDAVAAFGSGTTREIYVSMRDAGAPEKFRATPLGTPSKMYLSIGLFLAALFTAPVHPYLMFAYVKFNVALREGKPPPFWQAMRKFRGW
jgi:hypothetical protein